MIEVDALMLHALPWFFGTAALIFTVLCIFLIYENALGGATLSITIAVVSVLLAYLPQLDSLNALAISVKMKSNLDRADELISRVERLSLVSAQSSILSIIKVSGYAPSISPLINNNLLQLQDSGVSYEGRLNAAQPVVDAIANRLLIQYANLLEAYFREKKDSDLLKVQSPEERTRRIVISMRQTTAPSFQVVAYTKSSIAELNDTWNMQPTDRSKFALVESKIIGFEEAFIKELVITKEMDEFVLDNKPPK